MSGRTLTVRLTANFERNLGDIEVFLAEADTAGSFDRLLDILLDTVIPNLQRFPGMGRDFFQHKPGSVEAVQALDALQGKLPEGELREYVLADYLILYAALGQALYLLSIKHHRQLSFDFDERWSGA